MEATTAEEKRRRQRELRAARRRKKLLHSGEDRLKAITGDRSLQSSSTQEENSVADKRIDSEAIEEKETDYARRLEVLKERRETTINDESDLNDRDKERSSMCPCSDTPPSPRDLKDVESTPSPHTSATTATAAVSSTRSPYDDPEDVLPMDAFPSLSSSSSSSSCTMRNRNNKATSSSFADHSSAPSVSSLPQSSLSSTPPLLLPRDRSLPITMSTAVLLAVLPVFCGWFCSLEERVLFQGEDAYRPMVCRSSFLFYLILCCGMAIIGRNFLSRCSSIRAPSSSPSATSSSASPSLPPSSSANTEMNPEAQMMQLMQMMTGNNQGNSANSINNDSSNMLSSLASGLDTMERGLRILKEIRSVLSALMLSTFVYILLLSFHP